MWSGHVTLAAAATNATVKRINKAIAARFTFFSLLPWLGQTHITSMLESGAAMVPKYCCAAILRNCLAAMLNLLQSNLDCVQKFNYSFEDQDTRHHRLNHLIDAK